MNELPSAIQELISTPIRQQLFEIVAEQNESFTFTDIYTVVREKNLNIGVTSVQNFLRSLCFRGYLKEQNIKESKSRGRGTIHYQREQI